MYPSHYVPWGQWHHTMWPHYMNWNQWHQHYPHQTWQQWHQ